MNLFFLSLRYKMDKDIDLTLGMSDLSFNA